MNAYPGAALGGSGPARASTLSEFQNILAQKQKEMCREGLQAYITNEYGCGGNAAPAVPEANVGLPTGLASAPGAWLDAGYAGYAGYAGISYPYHFHTKHGDCGYGSGDAYGIQGYDAQTHGHGSGNVYGIQGYDAQTHGAWQQRSAQQATCRRGMRGGRRGQAGQGKNKDRELPVQPRQDHGAAVTPGLLQAETDGAATADDAAAAGGEAPEFLREVEAARGTDDALRHITEQLESLGACTIIEALHIAARQLPTSSAEKGMQQSQCAGAYSNSKEFEAMLSHLSYKMPEVSDHRAFSRLTWALGKFEVRSVSVDDVVRQVCVAAPKVVHQCTPQDLSNTIGGLARLYAGVGTNPASPLNEAVVGFANYVVELCQERVQALTAQCVANTLWSVARLRLRGQGAKMFVAACVHELTTVRELDQFTPQGLANVVWAMAELHATNVASADEVGHAKTLCQCVAASSLPRVGEFMPQELSMTAWAFAKLHGRGLPKVSASKARRGASSRGLPAEVSRFMMALAAVAQERVYEGNLSPQSVSNIAWALATLDLLGTTMINTRASCHLPARQFLIAAMAYAEDRLGQYSPQAVANLLWAAVRLEKVQVQTKDVSRFATACAKEGMQRMLEFTWRDLAGIAAALSYCTLQNKESVGYLTLLVGHAQGRCHELTPQAMLNITQAAVRIQVPAQYVVGMVKAIGENIERHGLWLNDVDHRQWEEVKLYCAAEAA